MTATETQPKFTVSLGDGWPGLYLVYATDKTDKVMFACTVTGVDSISEALQKAAEAFPEYFRDNRPDRKMISIQPIRTVSVDGTITPPRPPVDDPSE